MKRQLPEDMRDHVRLTLLRTTVSDMIVEGVRVS